MEQYKSIDIETGRHAIGLAESEWGALQAFKPANDDMTALRDRSCIISGQWYVVSVERQQAELARAQLAGRGLVPYLPMRPTRERHGRGSERTVRRPLFGMYLFVRCRPIDWGLVTSARGVRRLLGGELTPKPIDDRCIELIRLIEAEGEEAERARDHAEQAAAKARSGGRSGIIWWFTENDRIRIKSGPFAGLYGQLTAAVDVHDRIRALVNILGGPSSIELSAFDVEKAV